MYKTTKLERNLEKKFSEKLGTFLFDDWPSERIGEGHQEAGGKAELVVVGRFKGFRIKRQVEPVVHSIQELAPRDLQEFFL